MHAPEHGISRQRYIMYLVGHEIKRVRPEGLVIIAVRGV